MFSLNYNRGISIPKGVWVLHYLESYDPKEDRPPLSPGVIDFVKPIGASLLNYDKCYNPRERKGPLIPDIIDFTKPEGVLLVRNRRVERFSYKVKPSIENPLVYGPDYEVNSLLGFEIKKVTDTQLEILFGDSKICYLKLSGKGITSKKFVNDFQADAGRDDVIVYSIKKPKFDLAFRFYDNLTVKDGEVYNEAELITESENPYGFFKLTKDGIEEGGIVFRETYERFFYFKLCTEDGKLEYFNVLSVTGKSLRGRLLNGTLGKYVYKLEYEYEFVA